MKELVPRRFDRTPFISEAVLRPLGGGPKLTVQVFDMGRGGLATFSNQSMTAGLGVEITFRVSLAAVQAGLGMRDGRVAYNLVVPDGNLVGIAFAKPLETAELKLLEANWVRT